MWGDGWRSCLMTGLTPGNARRAAPAAPRSTAERDRPTGCTRRRSHLPPISTRSDVSAACGHNLHLLTPGVVACLGPTGIRLIMVSRSNQTDVRHPHANTHRPRLLPWFPLHAAGGRRVRTSFWNSWWGPSTRTWRTRRGSKVNVEVLWRWKRIWASEKYNFLNINMMLNGFCDDSELCLYKLLNIIKKWKKVILRNGNILILFIYIVFKYVVLYLKKQF